MLALVLLSLMVIGTTTLYFFDRQNNEYHLKRVKRKEKTVNSSLQYFLNDLKPIEVDDFITKEFDYKVHEIADVNSLEIIIYNLKGEVLINTDRNDYDSSKIKNKINPILLAEIQNKNEVFQESDNGEINSYSYAKNKNNQKMVIINIPYNPQDYNPKSEVWLFLNNLLKVFSILLIGAGLIAYLLSKYITKSIEEVSKKIKSVKINEENEKLLWNAEDEIGTLVNAYNEMINKLEISTEKLAKNERQTAWREMAKQVAHEIKNPLTPMKLSIQHLKRVLAFEDKKKESILNDFESKMIQQVDMLSEIANEFSNFAELPKAKMTKVNIYEVIKKTIDLYENDDKVTIKIIKKTNEDLTINGDENQLTRVFTNLINNSIQSISDNGRIEINISNKGDLISIKFIDNGVGIPKELQNHIFEPKFTTKSNGKGLGLSIVHQIVSIHNGEIYLQKSKEKETCFVIFFPKARHQ
tara:strand:- start:17216 stop:18622 length:1407 start_codon:yes stop_codon:yes gene_type:complete